MSRSVEDVYLWLSVLWEVMMDRRVSPVQVDDPHTNTGSSCES